jgi:hypothetical protein
MYRSLSPRHLVALYRAADVKLVTPLRDGMNLVAKEYVASRVDEDGVFGRAIVLELRIFDECWCPPGCVVSLHSECVGRALGACRFVRRCRRAFASERHDDLQTPLSKQPTTDSISTFPRSSSHNTLSVTARLGTT